MVTKKNTSLLIEKYRNLSNKQLVLNTLYRILCISLLFGVITDLIPTQKELYPLAFIFLAIALLFEKIILDRRLLSVEDEMERRGGQKLEDERIVINYLLKPQNIISLYADFVWIVLPTAIWLTKHYQARS